MSNYEQSNVGLGMVPGATREDRLESSIERLRLATQLQDKRIRELEGAIRRHMQMTQLEASATGAAARGTDHDLWFTLEGE